MVHGHDTRACGLEALGDSRYVAVVSAERAGERHGWYRLDVLPRMSRKKSHIVSMGNRKRKRRFTNRFGSMQERTDFGNRFENEQISGTDLGMNRFGKRTNPKIRICVFDKM